MAWRHSGDKPLSEPMMVSLPTHICVIRPQWVNSFALGILTYTTDHGHYYPKLWLVKYSIYNHYFNHPWFISKGILSTDYTFHVVNILMLEFQKIYSKSVCQWGCSKLQFLIYITIFNHIFIWILNILRWVKMADILQLTFWNCVFLNKNCFYLDPNFAVLFFWGSYQQLLSIGLCNDLVQNRQQAIIWARYDQGLGKMILRTAFILHIVRILILVFMKSTPNHFPWLPDFVDPRRDDLFHGFISHQNRYSPQTWEGFASKHRFPVASHSPFI